MSERSSVWTSNCSLPPPFLSRWTWLERDGCSFRLFEWLHDFHLFVQTNPNPYPNPNPNLNQFMPSPNLILTSVNTLPPNLVPHRCSAGPLVHLITCGWNSELSEQWAAGTMELTLDKFHIQADTSACMSRCDCYIPHQEMNSSLVSAYGHLLEAQKRNSKSYQALLAYGAIIVFIHYCYSDQDNTMCTKEEAPFTELHGHRSLTGMTKESLFHRSLIFLWLIGCYWEKVIQKVESTAHEPVSFLPCRKIKTTEKIWLKWLWPYVSAICF